MPSGSPESAGGPGAASPGPEARSVAATFLRRALRRGRLSHAYLLLGPAGSGKKAFALELAKRIFCAAGDDPCGECASCRQIEHGNHPGVGVYGPAEGKSAVDIDTIRDMCERSHYTRSHAFVAILTDAENMTQPAANALLKTLEEPPGTFIVVLTAASAGALLPTIVSRCHRLYIPAEEAGEAGDEVDLAALREVEEPGFLSRNDLRDWLSRTVPGASTARARARAVLGAWIRREREALAGSAGAELDERLDRLGLLLELRFELDGNVSADLVLERALTAIAEW